MLTIEKKKMRGRQVVIVKGTLESFSGGLEIKMEGPVMAWRSLIRRSVFRPGKRSPRSSFSRVFDLFPEDLDIRVKGSVKAWRELVYNEERASGQPLPSEMFSREVLDKVLGDVFEHGSFLIRERPLPRGMHAGGRQSFVRDVRRWCAWVYPACEYWLRRPRNDWPISILKVVKCLEKLPAKRNDKDDGKENRQASGRFSLVDEEGKPTKKATASILTGFFAEKRFYKERIRQGIIKWTDTSETIANFKRTFIMNNSYMNRG
jgi:hypothetical protein